MDSENVQDNVEDNIQDIEQNQAEAGKESEDQNQAEAKQNRENTDCNLCLAKKLKEAMQFMIDELEEQKTKFEGNPYYDGWGDFLSVIYTDDELNTQNHESEQEKLEGRLRSSAEWETYLSTSYGKTAEEVAIRLRGIATHIGKENNQFRDHIHHLQKAIAILVDAMIVSVEPIIRLRAVPFANDDQLDKLVHDSDPAVRASVAMQFRDKDLDILVNDYDPVVRTAVAKVGRDQDLDILVHDDDYSVIRNVVKYQRPQDLEYLRASSDSKIRKIVVENGRDEDLDFLVNDVDPEVRIAVAKHGRDKDLSILAYDDDSRVRLAVLAHNRKKDLDLLVDDPNEEVRIVVAEHGRKKDRKVFKNDPSIDVRMTYAFSTGDADTITEFVHNDHTADFFKKSVHSPGEKKHVSDIAFTLTQTLCQRHDFDNLEYLLTLTSKTSTQIPFTVAEYIAEFEEDKKYRQKLTDLLANSKKKLVKETVQKYLDLQK